MSLLFGFVIDIWGAVLPSASSMGIRILYLCGSLFLTAFGIMIIVATHLVPDPPTGAVQAISIKMKKPMGSIKIVYDSACVCVSLLIGYLGIHQFIGFGVATIASALLVGRILVQLQERIGKKLEQILC